MAQFRPPGENPLHQFFTQGMPQITRLVEGAREEKRIEEQQAREDTLSIVNTLINVSGKYTAAGDYKASSNALKNASNIVSKSPYLKDLNLEFLIDASDGSNEYLQTRDEQDSEIINDFLIGNLTALEARSHPLISKEGRKRLDGLQKSNAVSRYRYGDLEMQLDVINTLLNAIKKTETKQGRVPKDLRNIVKLLSTKLGEISTTAIYGGTKTLPPDLGGMKLSPGFWETSPEEQSKELLKMAEQFRAGAETEIDEIIIPPPLPPPPPPATQVSGFKVTPIEGDPRNVQIEYGGETGKISKTNWDIATGERRALSRKASYRTISRALKISPEEVERIMEGIKSAKQKEQIDQSSQDLMDKHYGPQ